MNNQKPNASQKDSSRSRQASKGPAVCPAYDDMPICRNPECVNGCIVLKAQRTLKTKQEPDPPIYGLYNG